MGTIPLTVWSLLLNHGRMSLVGYRRRSTPGSDFVRRSTEDVTPRRVSGRVAEHFVAWLGGAGVLATFATWAIGSYNNALALSLTARRQPASNDGASPTDDRVILHLSLQKKGPTRVRLEGCKVEIKALDGPPVADEVSQEAARSLALDFRGTGAGVALVREDEVGFETYFRVRHDQTVHVKVIVQGVQQIFEWKDIAHPDWPSSLVIPPSDAFTDAKVR